MAVELGIVGLPNVGKTTLFNALTRANALVANYPFTTIEPNIGVVAVPDERLDKIATLFTPEKVVPSSLRVVDIAGLVRGASKGEGLGNQFLGHIRTVDAIAMVVRTFRNTDIPHVTPELDPLQDVETVRLELVLADLATVERREEKTQAAAKAHPASAEAELAALQSLRDQLNQGKPVRAVELSPSEASLASEIGLLTAKPWLYVANVGEDQLPDGDASLQPLRDMARGEGAEVVVVCAQCEADLCDWGPADAEQYRRELGVTQSGITAFVQAGYRLLNLVTFFTTTGGKEIRAWPLRAGTVVQDAAGTIHSDMQRGFVRAEIVNCENLLASGSMSSARDRGLVHLEGKDYVVQDGDVVHVRFNV
jgi:ribosome-binding ATPase